jgi:hypothetical protein
VHGIENSHLNDRRASSTHSLQTIVSTATPSAATSYPRLQKYLTKQLSTQTPPTPSKATTHKNLPSHADNILSRRMSYAKTRSQDDNNIHLYMNRSLYESVDSTTDNHENENNLIKKEPKEIRVRCIFSRVGEIDTLNERYTAEIFFEASWYDDTQQIGSKYDPQMGHFNPQLVVLNHIGDSLRHDVDINLK